jgi:hypothetical protein
MSNSHITQPTQVEKGTGELAVRVGEWRRTVFASSMELRGGRI